MDAVLENIVIEALEKKARTPFDLHRIKNQFAEEFDIQPPPNSELIRVYQKLLEQKKVRNDRDFSLLLRKRKIRTLSGVSPVAVILKPYYCPGKCVFCPTEENVPKSYLSNEPAIMRAILNDYDPYKQVKHRIETLAMNGHPTDKIELIVMGGTWSVYPKSYQTYYIRNCLKAMNMTRSDPVSAGERSVGRASLASEQKRNETAKHRCVTMVLETRPDWVNEKEIKRMRFLGATRIEIGVQSLYDDVLDLVKRGHRIDAAIRATQLLKDAAFKVSYHMMPNLSGATLERDIQMFKELFEDPVFRPDMMKVYPCMVVPFSELKLWYEQGRHRPYTDEELLHLIFSIKPYFPRYLRVTRLIRDIPATSIIGGSKVSNLRQVAQEMMKEKGITCHCIRCREIRSQIIDPKNIELRSIEYEASEGQEFFLSFDETQSDKLCALLRLRFSSYSLKGKRHFIKELEGCTLIRELHTYGAQVPISERDELASQHLGFGKKLIAKAEEISKKHGYKKIAVIAGVGVRQYYRHLGYELEGTYMVKHL